MLSQKTDTCPQDDVALPEELQMRYFLEPQLVVAPRGAKIIAAKYEQGEKSWSR